MSNWFFGFVFVSISVNHGQVISCPAASCSAKILVHIAAAPCHTYATFNIGPQKIIVSSNWGPNQTWRSSVSFSPGHPTLARPGRGWCVHRVTGANNKTRPYRHTSKSPAGRPRADGPKRRCWCFFCQTRWVKLCEPWHFWRSNKNRLLLKSWRTKKSFC